MAALSLRVKASTLGYSRTTLSRYQQTENANFELATVTLSWLEWPVWVSATLALTAEWEQEGSTRRLRQPRQRVSTSRASLRHKPNAARPSRLTLMTPAPRVLKWSFKVTYLDDTVIETYENDGWTSSGVVCDVGRLSGGWWENDRRWETYRRRGPLAGKSSSISITCSTRNFFERQNY